MAKARQEPAVFAAKTHNSNPAADGKLERPHVSMAPEAERERRRRPDSRCNLWAAARRG
jgi:hypothetical protein